MKRQTADFIFELIFTIFLTILIIGIPLVFTSFTRSVFEVNKMLLLRLITALVCGFWLVRTFFYKDNSIESCCESADTPKHAYSIFGYKWKKTGLELPILIWLGINILSTIFSENIRTSIIGSYDRWEGLITVFNYMFLLLIVAKLVTSKWQLHVLFAGFMLSAGFSALYGVFQSLGHDFMHWSVDPTFRVFGCINNPVHFCAYMAMLVPVGIGWLIYLSKKWETIKINPTLTILKWFILYFFAVGIILCDYFFFEPSTFPFVMYALIAIAAVICYFAKNLIPSPKQLILWVVFFSATLLLQELNIIALSKESWNILLGTIVLMYIIFALPDWRIVLKRAILFTTILIYYAQYLSFSRATWLGFIAAMTLVYLLITHNFNTKNKFRFILDVLLTAGGIALFYLYDIFNLHEKSLLIGTVIFTGLGAYVIYSYFNSCKRNSHVVYDIAITALALVLLYLNFIHDMTIYAVYIYVPFHIIITAYLLYFFWRIDDEHKDFLSRLLLILIFAKLQFVAISLLSVFLYTGLVAGYYLLAIRKNPSLEREKKFWIITFLCLFSMVIIAPSIPSYISHFIHSDSQGSFRILKNIQYRVKSYEVDALHGTARTSMWKSAMPWIKDNWLLGTGPDSIKYFYPKYRRPEYGILEGGHNFTPDKLHNEYLNTMATRGIFGFFFYYFGIFLGWFIIVLGYIYKERDNPNSYLAVGFLAGALIYLGQVLFNFGVVATLVLFYVNTGLALAMATQPNFSQPIKSESLTDEKKQTN
ncbi:O-antigen ligase family protein, partial [Thermoproteota archaeon]